MSKSAALLLILSLSCIVIEAFFSMFEMASVSFNKVRLTYLSSQKKRRALWLSYLLKKPSRLFGTTLIIVTTVMQIGSEAARRFYETFNISSDYAPLTQAALVVIFGELAPLFAARRHPEAIALFNVPVVYFLSKLLFPVVWLMEKMSKGINILFNNVSKDELFLTREEIQRAFEERNVAVNDINKSINNIFLLKKLKAARMMAFLTSSRLISSDYTVERLQTYISYQYHSFFLVYHNTINNIVSVITLSDLMKAGKSERIRNFANSPWFISEKTSVLDVLQQFKYNNQKVAIVLDINGKAKGYITIEMVFDYIFGVSTYEDEKASLHYKKEIRHVIIEKKLSGDMEVKSFNKKYRANLPLDIDDTMGGLISSKLENHPSTGDVVHIDNFEFTVFEPSFLGVKTFSVKTFK